jgi:phosphoglycerate dehydrogenase-like enzyme
MTPAFRVGVTRDLCAADGQVVRDLSLHLLAGDPRIEWEFLPRHELELTPDTIAGFDALAVWEPGGVTEATLAGSDRLALIARFGMGLEAIDLEACTRRGVAVTTSPYAVREVMPAGAMAFLLALAVRLPEKDRIVRAGRWDDRFELVGSGTAGRTLGVIGLGNVGRGVVRMAEPFGLRRIAFDPYADPASVPPGVELVDLQSLLTGADFVCVTCPLTPETHHLIDRDAIATMRPGARLINVARGPIVDTLALADALRDGHLGGAALDVFETEPVEDDHPLLALQNVILSPHAIGYTDAAFRGLGTDVCASVMAVARGEVPDHVANPDVLEHARFEGTASGG